MTLTAPESCAVRRADTAKIAGTRSGLASSDTYQVAAALFAALADATRLTVVHALLGKELCTCEIAEVLGASDSNVSQHLRVLRSLQLIQSRRAGKFVYHRLDDGHVGNIVRGALAHLEHALEAKAS